MTLTKLVNTNPMALINKFLLIVTLLVSAQLALSAPIAQAQSGWLDSQKNSFQAFSPVFGVNKDARPIDPRIYVANIIQVVLGFLGVLCILLMIYAGFTWMTAAGDEKKVEKAQQTLVAAAIGTLIILAAFAVTLFVTKAIVNSTRTNILNR
jgi:hypothetical protein